MQNVNTVPAQAIELKDIHLPEQISNFPVAYGWWLLAVFCIFMITIIIIKMRKKIKINQIKKQALMQLKAKPDMSINDTITLLKWAAMHYFSRTELAKLFGDSLQNFLLSKLPIKHQKSFLTLSEHAFLNQYKSDLNSNNTLAQEKLSQAAKLWLTHALPPIKPASVTATKQVKQGAKQ